MAPVQNEEMEHEQTAQGSGRRKETNDWGVFELHHDLSSVLQEQQVEDRRTHGGHHQQLFNQEKPIMDYASPTVIQSGDYAQHSVGGSRTSQCGWLSEEEGGTDPNEGSDCDDGEIVQLTPEPLCEELEELLREVRGETKRKRPTRWDK
ncbi:unnamed protein product [Thlaspi arvense]|uniref:Uncharacterized protein n=1 Tax=Thlaspi arvense TaxID=13288 RepID=A0AAU9S528_THLAR|nr:unnamed protein product [Thlaspi arvense]